MRFWLVSQVWCHSVRPSVRVPSVLRYQPIDDFIYYRDVHAFAYHIVVQHRAPLHRGGVEWSGLERSGDEGKGGGPSKAWTFHVNACERSASPPPPSRPTAPSMWVKARVVCGGDQVLILPAGLICCFGRDPSLICLSDVDTPWPWRFWSLKILIYLQAPPTGYMLWTLGFFFIQFEMCSVHSPKMISDFPELLNFNRLFLKLNRLICNLWPVLEITWACHAPHHLLHKRKASKLVESTLLSLFCVVFLKTNVEGNSLG